MESCYPFVSPPPPDQEAPLIQLAYLSVISSRTPFNMAKAIPSSIFCGYVDIKTPALQYPSGYFNIGAAGFRSVIVVVDELAQAASSVQPNSFLTKLAAGTPLSREHVRPGKILPTARQKAAPYSVVGRSQGTRAYKSRGDMIVCWSSNISRLRLA
jgi:hypothetical protein